MGVIAEPPQNKENIFNVLNILNHVLKGDPRIEKWFESNSLKPLCSTQNYICRQKSHNN